MRPTARLQVDVSYPNQPHSARADGRLDRAGLNDTGIGQKLLIRDPFARHGTIPSQQLVQAILYLVFRRHRALDIEVKMTGMPSFGAIGMDDKEIWSVVAFIRKLPTVSEADFKTWTAGP